VLKGIKKAPFMKLVCAANEKSLSSSFTTQLRAILMLFSTSITFEMVIFILRVAVPVRGAQEVGHAVVKISQEFLPFHVLQHYIL
jgi:hypothetical protein